MHHPNGERSYDVFISHASEDKPAVAGPLAQALEQKGWSVWIDEAELTVGDSLEDRINEGLSTCRFGVVVLSEAFFSKNWPRRELTALAAKEARLGAKVILPVWHEITEEIVARYAPLLADKLAANTADGIEGVARELDRALSKASEQRAPRPEPLGAPTEGVWKYVAPMAGARAAHLLIGIPDGRVLAAGGTSGPSGPVVSSCELYDPDTDAWSVAADLLRPRYSISAVPTATGGVLILGGGDDRFIATSSCEQYDPKANEWMDIPRMARARNQHAAVVLEDGRVLALGGYDSEGPTDSAEIYDPKTQSWQMAPTMTDARTDFTAVVLPDARILAAGGFNYAVGGQACRTAEIYDPAAEEWRATAPLAEARYQYAATNLFDGRVLVAGGATRDLPSGAPSCEIYDPETEEWAEGPQMNGGRGAPAVANLSEARVLIAGGYSAGDATAVAEIFDAKSQTWLPAGDMREARISPRVVGLLDGRALAAGGYARGSHALATSEIYAS